MKMGMKDRGGSSGGDCACWRGLQAPPPGGLRPGDVDSPQNSAPTQPLKVYGGVLTSARLFDKFGGGSIQLIECVLRKPKRSYYRTDGFSFLSAVSERSSRRPCQRASL